MAIQVNGTQVIGNSRELTNITSVDAATATAFGNAGVGGGSVYAQNITYSTHAAFTKPADANTIWYGTTAWATSNGTVANPDIITGRPSSIYRLITTPALTSAKYGLVRFDLGTPSVHVRRGSYWGSQIVFSWYDSSANQSKLVGRGLEAWPSQCIFPKTFTTDIAVNFSAGDYFEIYVSDAYGPGAANVQHNANLSFNANTCSITTKFLVV
jgi:hypothetical protein|tara:strand:- start:659 stop:1294 length:636 start_codon:yes stop_codon:yes gene_type:complete